MRIITLCVIVILLGSIISASNGQSTTKESISSMQLDSFYVTMLTGEESVLEQVKRANMRLCQMGNAVSRAKILRTVDCEKLIYGTPEERLEERKKQQACLAELRGGDRFACADWQYVAWYYYHEHRWPDSLLDRRINEDRTFLEGAEVR